ncbi:MAG: DNA repair protein RecO [Ignavibacteria bacterium]|nr:DNA repair protein RecO [Ignavibacteria bacterium]
MPVIKTDAFVLKGFRYGESSKIVTLFTKEAGKITAVVKGARNYKSRICGIIESMNYISAIIYFKENRDLQLISSAEYKKSFPGIIKDYDVLQVSFRIVEMVNKSIGENEVNHRLFETLLNTFERLNDLTENVSLIMLDFQIKLTEILGLNPEMLIRDNSFETFLGYNELKLSQKQVLILKDLGKNNTEFYKRDENLEEDIIKLTDKFERYLLSHSNGSGFYKTKKALNDFNKIK